VAMVSSRATNCTLVGVILARAPPLNCLLLKIANLVNEGGASFGGRMLGMKSVEVSSLCFLGAWHGRQR